MPATKLMDTKVCWKEGLQGLALRCANHHIYPPFRICSPWVPGFCLQLIMEMSFASLLNPFWFLVLVLRSAPYPFHIQPDRPSRFTSYLLALPSDCPYDIWSAWHSYPASSSHSSLTCASLQQFPFAACPKRDKAFAIFITSKVFAKYEVTKFTWKPRGWTINESTRLNSRGWRVLWTFNQGRVVFFSCSPDGKVEDIFDNIKTRTQSYPASFSYTQKLKGSCTVTDCQTIWGDTNSVQNCSPFFMCSLWDDYNRVIRVALWEQISTGSHFCIYFRGKSHVKIFVILAEPGDLSNKQYPGLDFQEENQRFFLFFICLFVFKQDLAVQPRLASNTQSSCFNLLISGITDVHHCAQQRVFIL
jgi:hypothetical protein